MGDDFYVADCAYRRLKRNGVLSSEQVVETYGACKRLVLGLNSSEEQASDLPSLQMLLDLVKCILDALELQTTCIDDDNDRIELEQQSEETNREGEREGDFSDVDSSTRAQYLSLKCIIEDKILHAVSLHDSLCQEIRADIGDRCLISFGLNSGDPLPSRNNHYELQDTSSTDWEKVLKFESQIKNLSSKCAIFHDDASFPYLVEVSKNKDKEQTPRKRIDLKRLFKTLSQVINESEGEHYDIVFQLLESVVLLDSIIRRVMLYYLAEMLAEDENSSVFIHSAFGLQICTACLFVPFISQTDKESTVNDAISLIGWLGAQILITSNNSGQVALAVSSLLTRSRSVDEVILLALANTLSLSIPDKIFVSSELKQCSLENVFFSRLMELLPKEFQENGRHILCECKSASTVFPALLLLQGISSVLECSYIESFSFVQRSALQNLAYAEGKNSDMSSQGSARSISPLSTSDSKSDFFQYVDNNEVIRDIHRPMLRLLLKMRALLESQEVLFFRVFGQASGSVIDSDSLSGEIRNDMYLQMTSLVARAGKLLKIPPHVLLEGLYGSCSGCAYRMKLLLGHAHESIDSSIDSKINKINGSRVIPALLLLQYMQNSSTSIYLRRWLQSGWGIHTKAAEMDDDRAMIQPKSVYPEIAISRLNDCIYLLVDSEFPIKLRRKLSLEFVSTLDEGIIGLEKDNVIHNSLRKILLQAKASLQDENMVEYTGSCKSASNSSSKIIPIPQTPSTKQNQELGISYSHGIDHSIKEDDSYNLFWQSVRKRQAEGCASFEYSGDVGLFSLFDQNSDEINKGIDAASKRIALAGVSSISDSCVGSSIMDKYTANTVLTMAMNELAVSNTLNDSSLLLAKVARSFIKGENDATAKIRVHSTSAGMDSRIESQLYGSTENKAKENPNSSFRLSALNLEFMLSSNSNEFYPKPLATQYSTESFKYDSHPIFQSCTTTDTYSSSSNLNFSLMDLNSVALACMHSIAGVVNVSDDALCFHLGENKAVPVMDDSYVCVIHNRRQLIPISVLQNCLEYYVTKLALLSLHQGATSGDPKSKSNSSLNEGVQDTDKIANIHLQYVVACVELLHICCPTNTFWVVIGKSFEGTVFDICLKAILLFRDTGTGCGKAFHKAFLHIFRHILTAMIEKEIRKEDELQGSLASLFALGYLLLVLGDLRAPLPKLFYDFFSMANSFSYLFNDNRKYVRDCTRSEYSKALLSRLLTLSDLPQDTSISKLSKLDSSNFMVVLPSYDKILSCLFQNPDIHLYFPEKCLSPAMISDRAQRLLHLIDIEYVPNVTGYSRLDSREIIDLEVGWADVLSQLLYELSTSTYSSASDVELLGEKLLQLAVSKVPRAVLEGKRFCNWVLKIGANTNVLQTSLSLRRFLFFFSQLTGHYYNTNECYGWTEISFIEECSNLLKIIETSNALNNTKKSIEKWSSSNDNAAFQSIVRYFCTFLFIFSSLLPQTQKSIGEEDDDAEQLQLLLLEGLTKTAPRGTKNIDVATIQLLSCIYSLLQWATRLSTDNLRSNLNEEKKREEAKERLCSEIRLSGIFSKASYVAVLCHTVQRASVVSEPARVGNHISSNLTLIPSVSEPSHQVISENGGSVSIRSSHADHNQQPASLASVIRQSSRRAKRTHALSTTKLTLPNHQVLNTCSQTQRTNSNSEEYDKGNNSTGLNEEFNLVATESSKNKDYSHASLDEDDLMSSLMSSESKEKQPLVSPGKSTNKIKRSEAGIDFDRELDPDLLSIEHDTKKCAKLEKPKGPAGGVSEIECNSVKSPELTVRKSKSEAWKASDLSKKFGTGF